MVFWRKLILKLLNFKVTKLLFPVLWMCVMSFTSYHCREFFIYMYTVGSLTHQERQTLVVPTQDCCKEKAVIWASLWTISFCTNVDWAVSFHNCVFISMWDILSTKFCTCKGYLIICTILSSRFFLEGK